LIKDVEDSKRFCLALFKNHHQNKMREWMSYFLWGHRGRWLVERDVTINKMQRNR